TMRRSMLLVVAFLCANIAAQDAPVAESKTAVVLEISDAIGPATSDFFMRTLASARERKLALLILEMDTPGGLDSAMRDMIRAILASDVPVVTYVAPSGARAASAGTYLLYASHIAAMAPATNLGAATPVQIGGSPAEPRDLPKGDSKGDEKSDSKDKPSSAPGTAMERKAVNDAVAYIRGLAELRGRNAEWAEDAVRSASSLSATAALEQKVIDVIAADIPDLLRQIDGRRVKMENAEIQLATSGLVLERVQADWRTKLLSVLTNPNVAYLLMLVGVYGLLLEGYNPGAILPGVVGAISLLLALYAFQVLSVNYAGLGLMLLGLALIVAEAFTPSFGALGLGGITAFVFGSVILLDTDVPGFQVARTLIGGVALAAGLVMLGTVTVFARSRRRSVETGQEQMLREHAVAMEDFQQTGFVRVHGEIWRAHSTTAVREGQRLRVVRIDGLTLEVAPDT
ncbi:MAG TPA: nodulation protein NfeD, partial [Steroidobacteraceae bacterium]|nr:nodulation protein NfeD [Steroidobacteraceae bacterium]